MTRANAWWDKWVVGPVVLPGSILLSTVVAEPDMSYQSQDIIADLSYIAHDSDVGDFLALVSFIADIFEKEGLIGVESEAKDESLKCSDCLDVGEDTVNPVEDLRCDSPRLGSSGSSDTK